MRPWIISDDRLVAGHLVPTPLPRKKQIERALSKIVFGVWTAFNLLMADGEHLYGAMTDGEKIVLYRLLKKGTSLVEPKAIYLPASELRERELRDMIEEAIANGAWG